MKRESLQTADGGRKIIKLAEDAMKLGETALY